MVMRTAGQAPQAARRCGQAGSLGLSSRLLPDMDRLLPDMDALYGRLAEADEAEDTAALAGLAWRLYGLVGSLTADRDALRADLHQVLATAQAAVAAAAHQNAG